MGEVGQNNGLEGFTSADEAVKSFEKKFKDKTRNDWKNRNNFKAVAGKYTLIEMDSGAPEDDDDENEDITPAIVKYSIFRLKEKI